MQQKSLFTLKGCRNRLSYLGWSLLVVFISVIVGCIVGLIGGLIARSVPETDQIISAFFLLAFPLIFLTVLWIALCLAVQRCHDIGWSGLLLLLYFVPVVSFIFWLILVFAPSKKGANHYRDDS